MKITTNIFLFVFCSLSFASEVTVTIPRDHFEHISRGEDVKGFTEISSDSEELISFETSVQKLEEISKLVHKKTHQCGGFITSFEKQIFDNPAPSILKFLNEYSIAKQSLVNSYIDQINEGRILEFIQKYSSYSTRSSKTAIGVQALKDLGKTWGSLIKGISYADVKLFKHKDFDQPSVILTLKGKSDDIIVIGGHGDSINTDTSDVNAHAPGADDNASGISVITEVIRILAENRYEPENTIQFIAYAAEEVGLLGSMEIAAKYQAEGKIVKGVLNLDGTNYKGSPDLGMILYQDHTDMEQNQFLGSLIDTYVRLPWEYDKCGYACSDHYSWKYHGFSASFPAEARLAEENKLIHTSKDTLEVSNFTATHSVGFAKLAMAYVLELDK